MKNTLQQSEGLATPSKHNEFFKASLKLTAYYSAGVFLILTLFSLLVYVLFIQNLEFDADDGYVIVTEHNDDLLSVVELHRAQDAKERLVSILLTVDFLSLIFIIIVSYLLSRATLRPIEESYARQKRFVSDAAHELRTPLAVMKAGAEVLRSGTPTLKEYELFVDETLQEIEYMSAMAHDLLFLARRDNDSRVHVFEKINVSESCLRNISFMQPYALGKHVVLSGDIAPHIFVQGHTVDFERLVMNIVKNAIDYNVHNGSVAVSLSRQGSHAVLTVTDTGIGMNEKDLAHVFERFYKADTARSAQYTDGSGLGLSMVREIVDELKGTIVVTSNVGKGTRVEIKVPISV